MFKWYQNATKCYVYLPDVYRNHRDTLALDKWKQEFAKSEWFTRGWTLQELLAPKVVEFFSAEGERLGDKESLERQVHQITGIPIHVLHNKPLSEVSVDERLSWAAERHTTVEEDAIYCLLGIFDVQMPLIYGEGRQKAMTRLQREIQLQGLSGLNLHTTKNTPWIVPFERNPNFTGRQSELVEIEGKLLVEGSTSKIAITGLGGVGKTQLVLELLHRTKKQRPDCMIFWIPATTIETLQQGYLMIAQQLDIPGYEEKKDAKKLVQGYLSRKDVGQWILVFDNADDSELWFARPKSGQKDFQRLVDYLPSSEQGSIIFTTRDRKAAVKFAQQHVIPLSEMGQDMAMQLLKKTLPAIEFDSQNATALLTAVTCLPLAIIQAAAYINANGITLADYISLLEEKGEVKEEEIIELLSEDFEDYGRYRHDNVKNPVATTWLISFEQIQRSDPLAAEYLSFLACVNSREIPESLLPPGPSRKRRIDAIGTLTAYSFVSRRSETDVVLDIHRLVQLATRNWLRQEDLLGQWTQRAMVRLDDVFPEADDQNRAIWRLYLPHALQLLSSSLVNKDSSQRTHLMFRCGKCLHDDGRWNEAEAFFTEFLTTNAGTSDEDEYRTLVCKGWLAETYRCQSRLEEAEQLCKEVLEARKVKLGADHHDTLHAMIILAMIYMDRDLLEEAEKLENHVLECRKTKLGPNHSDTITIMSVLAATYSQQHRLEEAEKLESEVLEALKVQLGPDHTSTLTAMANLATTYWRQDRFEEAQQLELQVLSTRKTKLGADHPKTLIVMTNLAMTYRAQGQLAEAEQLQTQVTEGSKTRFGLEHPDTLVSMANLAVIYWMQGRLDEEEQLEIHILQVQKKKLGPDHPDTLKAMTSLASTYWKQDRLEEAEQLEVQILETRKTQLGADHPDTLFSMYNLAITWESLGRYKDAIQLIRDCVQLWARVRGSSTHPYREWARLVLKRWETDGPGQNIVEESKGDATGTIIVVKPPIIRPGGKAL